MRAAVSRLDPTQRRRGTSDRPAPRRSKRSGGLAGTHRLSQTTATIGVNSRSPGSWPLRRCTAGAAERARRRWSHFPRTLGRSGILPGSVLGLPAGDPGWKGDRCEAISPRFGRSARASACGHARDDHHGLRSGSPPPRSSATTGLTTTVTRTSTTRTTAARARTTTPRRPTVRRRSARTGTTTTVTATSMARTRAASTGQTTPKARPRRRTPLRPMTEAPGSRPAARAMEVDPRAGAADRRAAAGPRAAGPTRPRAAHSGSTRSRSSVSEARASRAAHESSC